MNMNTLQSTSESGYQKLSLKERSLYEEQGYVEVPRVFALQEIDSINAEIDRLRQKQGPIRDTHFMGQLGLRSEITKDICSDERILTLIEDLVFPGIAIYSAKMVEKPPFDSIVCHWHQDDAYYSQQSESQCRMSIWIPLQDCDKTNGCVWMVPGSHKWGLREYENRDTGTCKLSFMDGEAEIPNAVPCPIKAGSVLLFHALTWHRSLGNNTPKTRRSFIVSYQDSKAIRGNGDQHKILRPA